MSQVLDPPRPAGPDTSGRSRAEAREALDPRQGVIEEARRRRRRRRANTACAVALVAALIAGIAWLLTGASSASPRGGRRPGRPLAAGLRDAKAPKAPSLDVRLVPTLDVGRPGWTTVYEAHGRMEGAVGTGVVRPSNVLVSASSSASSGSRRATNVVVTLPQVTALLVNGTRRVPTAPAPGLPYGLRVARFYTPAKEIRVPIRAHGRLHIRHESIVPLSSRGQRITAKPSRLTPSQGKVARWRYPSPPAAGVCELNVVGLPAASARGGAVMTSVQPYPGQIFGRAFLACGSTEYDLGGVRLSAFVLVDAAHPGARPGAIPDSRPVSGALGVSNGRSGFPDGPGGLTERRSGNAWLAVEGGSVRQRLELLRHLRASVHV